MDNDCNEASNIPIAFAVVVDVSGAALDTWLPPACIEATTRIYQIQVKGTDRVSWVWWSASSIRLYDQKHTNFGAAAFRWSDNVGAAMRGQLSGQFPQTLIYIQNILKNIFIPLKGSIRTFLHSPTSTFFIKATDNFIRYYSIQFRKMSLSKKLSITDIADDINNKRVLIR